MKTLNRLISLLMVALMLTAFVPFTSVSAADEETENYNLTIENTYSTSFLAESGVVGGMSFFGSTEFEECYGNQLSGVAREIYDSMVKSYVVDKAIGEYTHTFDIPFTFDAEISGGSIVMNDALEEIDIEIDYAVQAARDAFLYDHPEVFWFRIIGSSYRVSATGNSAIGYTGSIKTITIIPKEIYVGVSAKISQYDTAVESALAAITVTDSRYNTLKNIHDYICKNAWYNLVEEQRVHSSEPFFIGDGGVVCEGYAKTFKIICDKLEIPCVLVSGDAGGAHMWNYVQMDDGKWYLVDATWDDQERKIYDTYFIANANTVGFNDVTISEERTERNDFSGTGVYNFIYPVLSTTAYSVHIHEWDSDYTVDMEPSCTEKGSKSIHCKTCEVTKSVTEIAAGHTDANADTCCDICDKGMPIEIGCCGVKVWDEELNAEVFDDSVKYYLYVDGTLEIYGAGEVETRAFYENDKVKKLVVRDGITKIGSESFDECDYLESVVLSSSVVTIGEAAFNGCSGLKDIVFPVSLVAVDNSAFIGTNLKYVYYGGTESQKYNISIATEGNDVLLYDAVWHYQTTEHICDYSEIIIDPTCEKSGIATFGCVVDGCSYTKTESVDALGHDMHSSEIIKYSTCTENGVEVVECSRCSCSEIKEILTIEHNYDDGFCVNCGDYMCSCNCHKSGLVGFIWKILGFFYKLFRSNKVCSCGVAHY